MALFCSILLKGPHTSAIGALPMRPTARQAPKVFIHAGVTDLKSTGAGPTKGLNNPAATALIFRFFSLFSFFFSVFLH